MTHRVNEATGEVTVDLAGETFRLKASLGRMADFQSALKKEGLQELFRALAISDQNAVLAGLRALCVSGNEAKFRDMVMPLVIADAVGALLAAMTIGMPKEEDTAAGEVNGAPATLN